MVVKNPPAKEDTWAFQPIGAPFPPNSAPCMDEPNTHVALWNKHGKPIHGRSWNNGGVVECSFPYLKAELKSKEQLEGQIQVLQYKGDHNTQGFWYEWIQYKERFDKAEGREMVKCGDSFPIYWKDRKDGKLLGYADNKTEIARFSSDGQVFVQEGPELNNMWIMMRNIVGGPPGCECSNCAEQTADLPSTASTGIAITAPSAQPVVSAEVAPTGAPSPMDESSKYVVTAQLETSTKTAVAPVAGEPAPTDKDATVIGTPAEVSIAPPAASTASAVPESPDAATVAPNITVHGVAHFNYYYGHHGHCNGCSCSKPPPPPSVLAPGPPPPSSAAFVVTAVPLSHAAESSDAPLSAAVITLPEATPTPPPVQEMAPVPATTAEPVVPAEVAPTGAPSPMDESSKDVVTAHLLSSHDQPTTAQTAVITLSEATPTTGSSSKSHRYDWTSFLKDDFDSDDESDSTWEIAGSDCTTDSAEYSSDEGSDEGSDDCFEDGAWIELHIGTAFGLYRCDPIRVPGKTNIYLSRCLKDVECSFPYLQLEGPLQEITGDNNTQGFWYDWIKYKERFDMVEGRCLVKCGDSFPIFWEQGKLLGFVDNKTEIALFSENGGVFKRKGHALNNMWILMRNTVGGPPDCSCRNCSRSVVDHRNCWTNFCAGDPWPAELLVQALNKTLATIPGQNPDQFVALCYLSGEPVMGRIWNEGGKIAANFGWRGREYNKNTGFINVLVYRPDSIRGFDYDWKPFTEAAVFGEEWHPVHVNHHKGDISPGVLTIDGKQFLGKVDVRNERATVAFDGKEHVFVGPAVHPTMVLCRKAKPGCKLD